MENRSSFTQMNFSRSLNSIEAICSYNNPNAQNAPNSVMNSNFLQSVCQLNTS